MQFACICGLYMFDLNFIDNKFISILLLFITHWYFQICGWFKFYKYSITISQYRFYLLYADISKCIP